MSKDILDDLDWENERPEEYDETPSSHHQEEVVMLKTFNTEEQAHICAASLKNEGIDAHVISSVAGQLTPFAYFSMHNAFGFATKNSQIVFDTEGGLVRIYQGDLDSTNIKAGKAFLQLIYDDFLQ